MRIVDGATFVLRARIPMSLSVYRDEKDALQRYAMHSFPTFAHPASLPPDSLWPTTQAMH